MTNSLALARAVYPDAARITETQPPVAGTPIVQFEIGGFSELFNPRVNDTQLIDVLAWLMLAVNCQKYNQGFLEIRPLSVVFGATISGDQSRITVIDHDGTAPSLVAAVVTAAERVAGEMHK